MSCDHDTPSRRKAYQKGIDSIVKSPHFRFFRKRPSLGMPSGYVSPFDRCTDVYFRRLQLNPAEAIFVEQNSEQCTRIKRLCKKNGVSNVRVVKGDVYGVIDVASALATSGSNRTKPFAFVELDTEESFFNPIKQRALRTLVANETSVIWTCGPIRHYGAKATKDLVREIAGDDYEVEFEPFLGRGSGRGKRGGAQMLQAILIKKRNA